MQYNSLEEAIENITFYKALATLDLDTCYEMLDTDRRYELTEYLTDEHVNPFNHITNLVRGIVRKDIQSLKIPNNIKNIDKNACRNCYDLTSVTIGNGVTSIGKGAFAYCDSLTSINIPDNIISIDEMAFYICYALTNITIPDSITNISSRTFQYCSSLVNIEIPNSITNIGDYVFAWCENLKTINYNGTIEEWNNITKSSEWDSKSVVDKVKCIDGEIELK